MTKRKEKMQMKKVLCIINTYKKNGPSRVIKSLIMQKNEEYEISVLSLFAGNDEEEVSYLINNGCKYYALNLKSKKNIIFNYCKLKKFIKENDFDIIHTHGIIPDFLLALMKLKQKKVTTIHNNLYEDYKSGYGIKSYIMIPVHIWAFKRFDKCVCCGKNVYDVLKNKLRNACFVRNGIENKKEKNGICKKNLLIDVDNIVYLYVGVLSERKNVLELMELFKNNCNDNEVLLVLGDGELKEKCLEYESKNIKLLGFVNNPTDYMAMADVYVSASKSEGFSISVVEALQNWCYLLLSDIPAHRECFEIDEKYYIGELFSSDNFKEKIEKLRIALNMKNSEKILEFQGKYLSNEVMVNEYIKVYKKLDL